MSRALYTPDILRLAVENARFSRLDTSHPGLITVSERAVPCGSAMTLDLALNAQGVVTAIGFVVTACAFGQASATLFARAAVGRADADIVRAASAVADWLHDDAAPLPDWPDIAILAAARATSARQGAILLPFRAAMRAVAQKGGPA